MESRPVADAGPFAEGEEAISFPSLKEEKHKKLTCPVLLFWCSPARFFSLSHLEVET